MDEPQSIQAASIGTTGACRNRKGERDSLLLFFLQDSCDTLLVVVVVRFRWWLYYAVDERTKKMAGVSYTLLL